MKNPGILYNFLGYLVGAEHHIGSRIAQEQEIAVAVLKGLNEREGGMHLGIGKKIIRIYPDAAYRFAKVSSKHIIADLTDERATLTELFQHRQHVTGSSTGIGLKQWVSLVGHTVLCEIYQ
jgi:hypothetical protein